MRYTTSCAAAFRVDSLASLWPRRQGAACATCHLFVEAPWAEQLGPRSARENDMLNFTVEPRANSRLGCQVQLTDALDGMVVSLPQGQH